jgi:hypothetical protein
MPLQLFNTRTRRVEDFASANPAKVRMYGCGPTVYDVAHIGNLRTYVFEDVLRRTLITDDAGDALPSSSEHDAFKKWSWLKAWAMQIAGRRGLKKAIVVLARRLAVIMHRTRNRLRPKCRVLIRTAT